MRRFFCLLLCAVLLVIPMSGCGGSTTLMVTTKVFGKTLSVKIFRSDDDSILTQIADVCKRDELIYSGQNPESELYALNLTDDVATTVSDDLMRMIRLAVYYNELSGGTYDFTASPLDALWDFSQAVLPDQKAIDEELERVGMVNISLGANTVTLDNGVVLDFGGLAEAKLVSDISDLLSGLGVRAEITIGDIICVVNEQEGEKIGLKMPYDDETDSLGTVTLTSNKTAVTLRADDGFLLEGVRYHKFLDPTTGMPAATDLLEVTVIAPSATQAYAMAQTIIRTGLYSGLDLTGKIIGADALMVTDTLEIRVTTGFTETYTPEFTVAYTEQVR